MAYWLMKSEPDVYSVDDLECDGRYSIMPVEKEHWDLILALE